MVLCIEIGCELFKVLCLDRRKNQLIFIHALRRTSRVVENVKSILQDLILRLGLIILLL